MQWGALKYMCQYLHFATRKKGGENVTLVELVCDEKLMYILAYLLHFDFLHSAHLCGFRSLEVIDRSRLLG